MGVYNLWVCPCYEIPRNAIYHNITPYLVLFPSFFLFITCFPIWAGTFRMLSFISLMLLMSFLRGIIAFIPSASSNFPFFLVCVWTCSLGIRDTIANNRHFKSRFNFTQHLNYILNPCLHLFLQMGYEFKSRFSSIWLPLQNKNNVETAINTYTSCTHSHHTCITALFCTALVNLSISCLLWLTLFLAVVKSYAD